MRINLGCGKKILDGYVNCDKHYMEGVDRVFDLDFPPYPFKDNEADEIYMNHVLEHIRTDLPIVMRELHRILKPGGKLLINVPYYNSAYAWLDPTHRRAFSFDTFSYFVKGHDYSYYIETPFSSIEVHYTVTKLGKIIPTNWLKEMSSKVLGHVIEEVRVELCK